MGYEPTSQVGYEPTRKVGYEPSSQAGYEPTKGISQLLYCTKQEVQYKSAQNRKGSTVLIQTGSTVQYHGVKYSTVQ